MNNTGKHSAVAAALSRQMGNVTVKFSLRNAYVEKEGEKFIIHVPEPHTDDVLEQRVTAGYIDHEIGHIKFSDFAVLDKARSNLERHVCNIFEDVRVEREMMRKYPGSRHNLRRLAEVVFSEENRVEIPGNDTEHDMAVILNWTVTMARRLAMPYANIRNDDADAENVISKGVMERLKAIANGALTTKSSHDSMRLARRYLHELKTILNDPPDDPQQQQQQQSLEQRMSALADSMYSDSMDEAMRGAIPDMARVASHELSKRHMGDDLHEYEMDRIDRSIYEPYYLNIHKGSVVKTVLSKGALRVGTIIASGLGTRLRMHLESERRKPRKHCESGVVIDGNRLVGVPYGERRVFRRRSYVRGMNTEVVVLVDTSGSMNNNIVGLPDETPTALDATYAALHGLATALTGLPGLKFSIAAFNGVLGFIMLKKFSDVYTPKAKQCVIASGGTPTGGALMTAKSLFSSMPHTRRLIVLLTDGHPNTISAFTKAMRCVIDEGIQCAVLGFGFEGVPFYMKGSLAKCFTSVKGDGRQIANALIGSIEAAVQA